MPKKQLKLEVIAKTNTGMVREANEDNFVVTPDSLSTDWILPKGEYNNSEGGTVMVVADGMGGLNAGEVASNIAVDSIKAFISKSGLVKADTAITGIMRDAILQANADITRHSQTHEETQGMGSTLVMAWVNKQLLHLSWVGDSRCYIWRGGKLQQLSKDHSYVQSLVDDGKLTTEQAFYHPENNVILQSLGEGERKPKPDYATFALSDQDIVLLCSDGLNAMLQDDQIEAIITTAESLQTCADQLIEAANAAGGSDNITVILAKIISGASLEDHKETTLPDEQKRKKKGRMLIFGLLILAILATASFFGSPGLMSRFRQPHDSTSNKKGSDTTKKVPPPAHKPANTTNTPPETHTPADNPEKTEHHPKPTIRLPSPKPAPRQNDSIKITPITKDTTTTKPENQQ